MELQTGYQVTYNGLEPWGPKTGTPFVSLDVDKIYVAGQIGEVRTVTLNGTFPSGGLGLITGLAGVFSQNFKAFSAPNVNMPCAMVQEINFGSQNYLGKTDYTIVLKDFSGFLYGVSDPIDSVSFQSESDGSVTINHKISAVGASTGISTAFENACTFVQGRTGISNFAVIGTVFISNTNLGSSFLQSQQESVNRIAGSYGISEVWRYDPLRGITNGVFKRFAVDCASGIGDDYMQVSVNGTYAVGKDVWDTGIHNQVIVAELYSIATGIVSGLNPLPLSFTMEAESISQVVGGITGTRTVTAKSLFDNSPSASFFDCDIEASKDLKNDITQIAVKGVIIGSGRHVRRKYASAYTYFTNTFGGWDGTEAFLYSLAISGATDLGYTGRAYNPSPKSMSIVFNSGQGTITANASFDNGSFASGFTEFGWNVNTDCGLNVFKPHASANTNGFYIVQDLSILNRTNVTLNGNFSYPAIGVFEPSNANSVMRQLQALEGSQNAFLESESYNNSSGDSIRTGFSYSYSKDGRSLDVMPVNGKIFAGTSL